MACLEIGWVRSGRVKKKATWKKNQQWIWREKVQAGSRGKKKPCTQKDLLETRTEQSAGGGRG